jgi:hypothetical protein
MQEVCAREFPINGISFFCGCMESPQCIWHVNLGLKGIEVVGKLELDMYGDEY